MKNNNLPLALVGAIVSALIGAIIWALVTNITGYQIGWMAVGIGILVGFSVRFLGKGSTPIYSIIGAVFALVGCLTGNLLSMFGYAANEFNIPFFTLLTNFDYSQTFVILKESFAPMDLLFYGIAVWEGFKFAIIPEDEFSDVQNNEVVPEGFQDPVIPQKDQP